MLRKALACAAFALVAAASSDASAWCLTTTRPFTPTDAEPCDTTGTPVFWPTRCVDMYLNRTTTAEISVAAARSTMITSFATWATVTCPADVNACSGASVGPPSLVLRFAGETDCGAAYTPGGSNANVVVFYGSAFPHPDAATTLALTTLSYETATGKIVHAALEVNADRSLFDISVGDPSPTQFDLQSIITHETGHVIGLAHTQPTNTEATMVPRYDTGQTFLRTLEPDDICGECAAAPPTRDVPCDPGDPGACAIPGGDAGVVDATTDAPTDVSTVTPDALVLDAEEGDAAAVDAAADGAVDAAAPFDAGPVGEPQPYDACTCRASPGASRSGLSALLLPALVAILVRRRRRGSVDGEARRRNV